jgi:hypothetical protein
LFTTSKRTALNENAEHIISTDVTGSSLLGENSYLLHMSPGLPACNFWSVIVYDIETGLIIVTDQSWPSVYSKCKKLLVSGDASVDILFGPEKPGGKENNWIKTIPGKSWKMIMRLYELSEVSSYNKWKPREIKLLE